MKAFLLVSMSAALIACSGAPKEDQFSSYVSEQIRPAELPAKLKIGDVVTVTTANESRYRFRVTKVEGDAFWGTARDNKQYRVPYKTIASLHVRRDKSGPEMAGDFLFTVFECLDIRC